MKKMWFVVYTRSRCEKKVANALTKKNIINYCPLNMKIRQWSDRKKMISEPLFSSYVFIYIEEDKLVTLKNISDHIVNPVFWLGKPARIKDEEIEAIRNFLKEYSSVKIVKQQVKLNDKVRIIRGAFLNQEATVFGFKNNMISLQLPSLGYMILSEINASDVEVIPNWAHTDAEVYSTSIAI
jgi:transcription antitermination factor NusG